MITHEIEIVKPVVYSGTIMHTTTTRPYPDISNQTDLDNWLNTTAFNEGDYVTFMHVPVTEMSLPYSVSVIKEIHKNFNNMTTQAYAPYNPLLIKRESLPQKDGALGHTQLDTVKGMRKISEAEWMNTVRPYLDRVRNSSQSQA